MGSSWEATETIQEEKKELNGIIMGGIANREYYFSSIFARCCYFYESAIVKPDLIDIIIGIWDES